MTSRFWHALNYPLMTALAGGLFLIIQTIVGNVIPSHPVLAAALATAVVAPLFLPLQEAIGRLVNRLVGSSPPTAYHVLADLTALSGAMSADASNLSGVAAAIAARMGARSCRLTVVHPGLRNRSYAWPASSGPAADDVVVPIRHGGEQIGTMAVSWAAGARRYTQRRARLEEIANSLGAIVAVSRLGIELERQLRAAQAHAEEIAVARRQTVAEMDGERRRMERNLHDGAQHHLVSLRMTLGLVEHGVASGQFDQAREGLSRLASQIDNAEAVLAETATGVSSILLTERGLIAALNSDLSGAHSPITVTSPEALSGRRFPPEIEAAVYFCCLEAVSNARKHAPGAAVGVRLGEADGILRFTVHDDGPGFASDSGGDAPAGRGLRNVTARIASVGGTLAIRSVPGVGTTIEGSVPLPRKRDLLDRVRELVREARTLYDGSADSEQLRQLQTQLAGRAGVRQASSVLRALDALLRASPRSGDRAIKLRYQVEQIRSETHELTEVELLDELQSGTLPLTSEERQLAEELLGAAGSEPRARLGLAADADTTQLRLAAGQQLARWQRRASHPASTRAVRDAAEILVRTCERLLTQAGTG
ncbi:MAG: sensor histidine kinase [Pseudonocardiaceae bacterium]